MKRAKYICPSLPHETPTLIDKIGSAAAHGLIAGSCQVIGQVAQKNFKATSGQAALLSTVMYYVSLYSMNYMRYYNQEWETAPSTDNLLSSTALKAATDTATTAAFHTVSYGSGKLANFFTNKGNSWTATFFKGISVASNAARFAPAVIEAMNQETWTESAEELGETAVQMATGMGTQTTHC